MRAAALLTALMLLSAGCIGMGGDDADSDAETASTDAPGSSSATNATGATNDSHAHEAKPEPHFDNRTGETSSTKIGIPGGASGYQGAPSTENLTVPAKSSVLRINLTADSSEIDAEIYGPDCERSPNQFGNSCSQSLRTSEDQSSFSTNDPAEGNWSVDLHTGETGSSSASYTLTFYYVDAHKPSGDHHS